MYFREGIPSCSFLEGSNDLCKHVKIGLPLLPFRKHRHDAVRYTWSSVLLPGTPVEMQDVGWSVKRPRHSWIQGCNFQSHPHSLRRGVWRNVQQSSNGQGRNQSQTSNEAPTKTQKDIAHESVWRSDHVLVLAECCIWWRHWRSSPFIPHTALSIPSIWLFVCILCNILYNKLVNSVLWVPWATLAN